MGGRPSSGLQSNTPVSRRPGRPQPPHSRKLALVRGRGLGLGAASLSTASTHELEGLCLDKNLFYVVEPGSGPGLACEAGPAPGPLSWLLFMEQRPHSSLPSANTESW